MNRKKLFKEIKNFTLRKSNGNIALILGLDALSKKATKLLSEAITYDRKHFPKPSKKQLLFYQEYLLPILSLALYYNEYLISTKKTPTDPNKKNNFVKKRVKKYLAFLSLHRGNMKKLNTLFATSDEELFCVQYLDIPPMPANAPFYPSEIDALVSHLPNYLLVYAHLTVAKEMVVNLNNSALLLLLNKFAWKGKYNTLAIFIYNLYCSRTLGNANFKKHELISFFSIVFSCDFSNVYHQSIYDFQIKKIASTSKK